MAVQQNKKSPSKRGMHRSHDHLSTPPLAVEPTTGEVHLRHHVSPTGYYRGKKVVKHQGRVSPRFAYPFAAASAQDQNNSGRLKWRISDGCDCCHRLHGWRPRRARDRAGRARPSGPRLGVSVHTGRRSGADTGGACPSSSHTFAACAHPARERSHYDGRATCRGAAGQEGFVHARGHQPRQERRRTGVRQRRQHRAR